MSITVSNLTKQYGEQKAVNAANFTVEKGEIVGFLGPNGAGKSTTMKMLSCFIPPTEGTATVCGHDVEQHPEAVKKLIGYLPENNPLYYDMYVKEYLHFVARVQGVANKKEQVAKIIEETGLTIEQNKKIGQLSKGYKQRVGLAQALIHDPEVLILDEPTSGLDPNQLADIRQLIINLGKEKTVLLSTHIMQEVQAMCDRIIIINQGKIVANDQTENLRQSQQGMQYTVEFNKAIDVDKLTNALNNVNVLPTEKNTYSISSSETTDQRAAIFRFAVANDLVLLTLIKTENNLEDVFRELTRN